MDISQYFRFLLALAFVLGLILLVAFAVRKFGLGNRMPVTKNRNRRLEVVEVLPMDTRRRLVLLRRDNREHLVLLNPGQGPDLLIESGNSAPTRPDAKAGEQKTS